MNISSNLSTPPPGTLCANLNIYAEGSIPCSECKTIIYYGKISKPIPYGLNWACSNVVYCDVPPATPSDCSLCKKNFPEGHNYPCLADDDCIFTDNECVCGGCRAGNSMNANACLYFYGVKNATQNAYCDLTNLYGDGSGHGTCTCTKKEP